MGKMAPLKQTALGNLIKRRHEVCFKTTTICLVAQNRFPSERNLISPFENSKYELLKRRE